MKDFQGNDLNIKAFQNRLDEDHALRIQRSQCEQNPEDALEMLRFVQAEPGFVSFEQNGSWIGVQGFLTCGHCGQLGNHADFLGLPHDAPQTSIEAIHAQVKAQNAPFTIFVCPSCDFSSEESDFPDAGVADIWDAYHESVPA